MSDFEREPANDYESWRFSPEDDCYIVPIDPYNERFLQFTALKHLGYPVILQKVDTEDLPEKMKEELSWEAENYSHFIRPVVLQKEFGDFVEGLDVTGDCIRSEDSDLQDKIDHHPVKLVWDVDCAYVRSLGWMVDALQEGRDIPLKDSGTGILSQELVFGCFIAAIERYTERKAAGYEYWTDENDYFSVEAEHFIKAAILKNQGFRPASPEQLGALVVNYYELAEKAQPEILKFKQV